MRTANRVLEKVPVSMKYRIGWELRKSKLPYSLVNGLRAVQIGAPFDTLHAGRSRGAYLGIATGSTGHLLICEPLAASTAAFEAFARDNCDSTVTVVTTAVWSEPGELELNVDDAHPATNFSGDTVDYSDERKAQFRKVTVPKQTLDQIVADANFGQPDLVSITTNWAEEEILAGMAGLLENGVRYVCLAIGKDGEEYGELMASLGYEVLGYDDRGVTYERIPQPAS